MEIDIDIDKILGKNLRNMRKKFNVSQSKLAKFCGITFQQIQKYENGKNRISASRLCQFCKFFKVQPNDFYKNILIFEE